MRKEIKLQILLQNYESLFNKSKNLLERAVLYGNILRIKKEIEQERRRKKYD